MIVQHLQSRLLALPVELRAAAAEEWQARRTLKEAQDAYEMSYVALKLSGCFPGKTEKEREQQAQAEASANPSLSALKLAVARAEEEAEVRKQASKMLEDEFSSLRNLVRLVAAQMVLAASGVQERDVPVVDQLLDRMASGAL